MKNGLLMVLNTNMLLDLPRNSCTYKCAGTKFFRLASSKILGEWGSNLQNVEKEMRGIYIPDGFRPELRDKCLAWLLTQDNSLFTEEELVSLRIFNQSDQSGAEALIVAYLCRPGNFRDLFLNKVKPHVFVALHVFPQVWQKKMNESGGSVRCDIKELLNTPIPKIRDNPFWPELDALIKSSDNWIAKERYYFMAKAICHMSNYGGKYGALQMDVLAKSRGRIVISKDDAIRFMDIYHGLFPEIHEWHQEVRRQVEETNILFNLQGFPIEFTTKNRTEQFWKEVFSSVPQSSVASITNMGYTDMQNYIEDTRKKWDMLANTHDSMMSQSPLLDCRECQEKMQSCLERELISPRGDKFKMRSEVVSGFNWAPYKKDKNELGLREIKWN